MNKSLLPEKILSILENGERSAEDLCAMLGSNRKVMNSHLSNLRKNRKVYVSNYIPCKGPYILVYASGDHHDAAKPKKTRAQASKDYYEKLKSDPEKYKELLRKMREKKGYGEYVRLKIEINLTAFDPVTFWVPRKNGGLNGE